MERMMFDVVITGGRIFDGTGGPPFRADIAIRDGRIVEIGTATGPARDTIDAAGAIVTPGFIDIHTHYDGQFLWDQELEPSFSNGVTTAIAGNCGVGFAPVRAGNRKDLIDIMEGVEDIPGIVLDEGLDWSWESFPDYLDKLAARQFTMDVATHVTHAPLRVYVMGDRAMRHEAATDADLAEMQRLVREGMAAGAVGFSAARIIEHRSATGAHVPGTFAEDRELAALAGAMGESGHGVFQLVPLGAAGDTGGAPNTIDERLDEHERFVRIARAAGRPVTYILHAMQHAPDEWRQMLAATAAANADGLDIRAQVASRGLGWIFSLDGYHLFAARPSYLAIAGLPRRERAVAMRDPARRAAILAEEDTPEAVADPRVVRMIGLLRRILPGCYAIGHRLDYEPDASRRVDAIAAETGRTMAEVVYDVLAEGDGGGILIDFAMNYVDGGLDAAHALLADPNTVSGLSDGGAHLPLVCDGASPTFHLTFWARDRARGPVFPIEKMVNKLTGEPAALYDLDDRGTIAVGKRADINVIDFDRLASALPEMVFDLPSGGPRLLQFSQGYRATLVNGVVTRRDDAATGAKPGRLLRAGRAAETIRDGKRLQPA
ncbi:amidohydrolase family protein [Sphingomonas solaris]|uniref:Amidohydrolase family protein n=2 Tax=Alterirhizorhabdus solaris TaxID=2529389 RepID=A0A558RA55_9SPHN|nr:amidohydrolase family protein [Sphingomonas solaris]